jgi:hypothetical protein
MNNDLSPAISVGPMTFDDSYTLSGNALTLTGDVNLTVPNGSLYPQGTLFVCNVDLKIGTTLTITNRSAATFNGVVDLNGQTLSLGPSPFSGPSFNNAVNGKGNIATEWSDSGNIRFNHDGTFDGILGVGADLQNVSMPKVSVVLPVSRLTGAGTLGDVTTYSLSIGADSGAAIGTLNTKSLTITGPFGGLAVDLVHGGPSDKTNVTGAVILNSSVLVVRMPGAAIAAGDTFTIIDNDDTDAVTGMFFLTAAGPYVGLPEGATFSVDGVTFQITYRGGDGNDVVLTARGPTSTSTTLSQSAGLTRFGEPLTLTASVTSSSGTPTGVVTFTADGMSVAAVPVQNGTAMASVSTLEVGNRSLSAVFAPSSPFAASASQPLAHAVARGLTATSVVSNHPASSYGQTVVFTVTVTVQPPASGKRAGQVTVLADGAAIGTAPLANGVASVQTAALHAGTHAITATFAGDAHFESSSAAAVAQTIAKAQTAVDARALSEAFAGAPAQVAVSVSEAGSGLAAVGDVSLSDGGAMLAQASLVNGAVQITLPPRSVGVHQFLVAYAGNADFEASSVTIRQTVVNPLLSVRGARIAEGNHGLTNILVVVTLAAPSPAAVRVAFATLAGTATEAVDYEAASGVLDFAPGEQAKAIELHIIGDLVPEDDETFSVVLSDPVGAVIETTSTMVVIDNDDAAPSRRRAAKH